MTSPADKKPSAALGFAIDYGPVLAFFLAYRWLKPTGSEQSVAEMLAVTKSTVVFIIATIVALIVSKWKLGKIAPMVWLSAALVCGFGAMTVFLHDSFWIQIKPTVIYLLFAGALLVGAARGKALLKLLLASAFEGLDEAGWLKLSRNWGLFFLFFAGLNEVLRHFYNAANNGFGTWIALKLWVFMPLSVLFTFAHIPMLLRHGLGQEPPPIPPSEG